MDVMGRRRTSYWNWLGSRDLTLLVDGRGLLWKFRGAGPTADRALDARLEAGALVITRSGLGRQDAVEILVHDALVDFIHVGKASDARRSRVSLPEGLDFDEARTATSRRGGMVEVRVPLARAGSAEMPSVAVAEPAVAVSARSA
jgi:hypothetical protein